MLIAVRECGYAEQAVRIAEYQIRHAPESELPYVRDDFRDGCSFCSLSIWESRTLPDGRRQTRCTECHSTITWD